MKVLVHTLCVTAAAAVATGTMIATASGASSSGPLPNFAGYQGTNAKGNVATVTASFNVPTITCKKTFSGISPGALVLTKPAKKGSVKGSGASVAVACMSGTPSYQAIDVINGQTSPPLYTVSPGDKMTVAVTVTAKKTKATISDVTSGDSTFNRGNGGVGQTAAVGDLGLIIDADTNTSIDPFSKIGFSAVKVNAKPIGALAPSAFQRTHGKTVQIAVSRLVAKKSFAITFKDSK